MKSPADMKIIQIDITNACTHNCSNCTRFCGQHPKVFFMETDTFRKAVDSMEGFNGCIGIIGGEPTLHPQFGEMIEYVGQKVKEPRPYSFLKPPVKSFSEYAGTVKYQRGRHRGLFTSLGNGYYKHFEQIQDVFAYQSINDHQSCNTHQAILITRKELGIPDEEWFKLRDCCWIQNLWSASITPKGAFFCEIAASLDMLFNGPGGWPIEPGWWKRKPCDFKDQLHWCEMCSVALKVPMMEAGRQEDIVSPAILEKLKQINGPKIRNNQYVVFDPKDYDAKQYSGHEANPIWYLPKDQGDSARVSPTHGTLYPRKIDVVVLEGSSSRATITKEKAEKLEFTDWLAVFKSDADVDTEFLDNAPKCVLNPGCFYYCDGKVSLINRRARALAGQAAIRFADDLISRWEPKKRVRISNYPCIGELTKLEQLSLLANKVRNRGAFLLPAVG